MKLALGALLVALAAMAVQAADTSRACQTARKKVEREQRTLDAANETIAHDRQARESCASRSACARYDAAIADAERRNSRLASRLARYEAEAAEACGS